MPRVCHFSSVHPYGDIRVQLKECVSAARAGFETYLVIRCEQDHETDGVHVVAVKTGSSNRFLRVIMTAWQTYRKARALNADIYQFHDAELLPYGILLRLSGKHVIYDVHEDMPRDLPSRDYLPWFVRYPGAVLCEILEDVGAMLFSSVVSATPHIHKRFARFNRRAVNVNNYPFPHELAAPAGATERQPQVCYVGGMSRIRGLYEMVEAARLSSTRLVLAGKIEAREEAPIRATPGWEWADHRGQLSRDEVGRLLSQCSAALVLFYPEPNHLNAQPNKLFEYMSAGIPLIASDFPLWREIVEGNQCGLCVDPQEPAAIAEAIRTLLKDPVRARTMGENGRRAVLERYNWGIEEKKLLGLYRELLGLPEPVSSPV